MKRGHAIYSIFFARRDWRRIPIFPAYASSRHCCLCQHGELGPTCPCFLVATGSTTEGKNWISPGMLSASPLFSALRSIHPSILGGKGQIKARLWRVGLGFWSSELSCSLLAAEELFKRLSVTQKPQISWFSAGVGLLLELQKACSACECLEKHPGFSRLVSQPRERLRAFGGGK